MLFGYGRVSTREQNEQRQMDALVEYGIEPRNIFVDKVSGARSDRPALDDMLSRLREGDTVVVLSFDRLARSLKQLLELSELFDKEGVNFVSLHEQIDTGTPQGKLFFHITSAIAEYQRNIINQAAEEGREAARKEGRSLGGRPRADKAKLDAAVTLYIQRTPISGICRATGLSVPTIYRELDRKGIERNRHVIA